MPPFFLLLRHVTSLKNSGIRQVFKTGVLQFHETSVFHLPNRQHTDVDTKSANTQTRLKHLPSHTSTAWRNIARCKPFFGELHCARLPLPTRHGLSLKNNPNLTERGQSGHPCPMPPLLLLTFTGHNAYFLGIVAPVSLCRW